MTTTAKLTAAASLLVLTGLAMTPLFAQDAPPPGPPPMRRMGPGGPGFGPGGPMGLLGPIGRGLRELDLSDAQREQLRGVMTAHADELKAIGDRLRQAHQNLDALITGDTADESAIRARSAEVAAVQADAAVLRARMHQEAVSLLTAEQQTRLKELRAQEAERDKARAERMKANSDQRRGRRPGR